MRAYTTVIIGAGQCGLAMSRVLSERSVDHVILERGEVANSWRTERWDSLRLLTPNWQSRLPGFSYDGPDQDGFMAMPELIERLSTYAVESHAPVVTETTVRAVMQIETGYRIETSQGPFQATTLVLATGACALPNRPAFAEEVPKSMCSLTPHDYKRPSDLPDGGVLVVGGSATGVQLALELQASGRQVTLSLGEHIRVPRTYRGRDIKWWMDVMGLFDQRYDEIDDIRRVRRTPSLQLAGTRDHRMLDLNRLSDAGVDVVGRLAGIRDGRAVFSGSLANHCALADLKMNRLLEAIDHWAGRVDLGGLPPAHRFEPTRIPTSPQLEMDLTSGALSSVLWATGYRPDYTWLEVPLLDRKGRLRHDGGITAAPGLFAMGLPFMRRRKSTLIDGAGADAYDLIEPILAHLDRAASPAMASPIGDEQENLEPDFIPPIGSNPLCTSQPHSISEDKIA